MFLIQPSSMGLLKVSPPTFVTAPELHKVVNAINLFASVHVCEANHVTCDADGWAPKDSRLTLSVKVCTPLAARWIQQVFHSFAGDIERRAQVSLGVVFEYVTTQFQITPDEHGEWKVSIGIDIYNSLQQTMVVRTLLKAVKGNRMQVRAGNAAGMMGNPDTPYPDGAIYPKEELLKFLQPGARPLIPSWHVVDGVIKTTYWNAVQHYSHILIGVEQSVHGDSYEQAKARVDDYKGFKYSGVEKILSYLMDAYPPFVENDEDMFPQYRPWVYVKNRTSEWPRRPRGV